MIVLFGVKTKENGGNPDNRDKLTLSKGDIKLSKGFRVEQVSFHQFQNVVFVFVF